MEFDFNTGECKGCKGEGKLLDSEGLCVFCTSEHSKGGGTEIESKTGDPKTSENMWMGKFTA